MDKRNPKEAIKSICCVGCECIGMYTCCLIASVCPDVNVAIVDLDPGKICAWNCKNVPSHEPGLDDMLKKCQNKNLVFTTETEKAIEEAEVIFLCLNESFAETGLFRGIKTEKMEEAATIIAKVSKSNKIVVQKSTMPVGACQYLAYFLDQNKKEDIRLQVVYNPDFGSEGSIVRDLVEAERVLLGGAFTPWTLPGIELLLSIYSQWIPRCKILTATSPSSELAKLAANAFLAQKLSALSALSLICGGMEALDVTEVLRIYSEVTHNCKYIEPTFRFGGQSLERDLVSLTILSRDLKLCEMADYWQQSLDMNEFHMTKFKRTILSEFYQTLVNKKMAVLGFAYKRGVATTLNSPASALCKALLDEGAKIAIYDPEADKRDIALQLDSSGCLGWQGNVTIADDVYKATAKADALIFCTDWPQFTQLDFFTIHKNMLKPAYIFDGRKFLPHLTLHKMGFIVKTIGVNSVHLLAQRRREETRNDRTEATHL